MLTVQLSPAPALSAIEYETVTFNNSKGAKTAYVGAGPEADKAWEHVTMHSKMPF